MSDPTHFHLHLVSDSTGETVSSISRAAMAQFDDVDPIEHVWSLVRTRGQMERAIAGIREHPGIVLYTIVDDRLQHMLHDVCQELKVPCIPVLSRVVTEIAGFMKLKISSMAGRKHELTEDYFSRMDAINFALTHDDGQNTAALEQADIVLVGASRTSKSPTSIYLAYRGYKTANVPYVMGCPLPTNLTTLKHPLVVGLVISPERLVQIRKTRLASLKEDAETDYIDVERVKEEVDESRKLFSKNHWMVIDVTRRSVEETAASIIQKLNDRREQQV